MASPASSASHGSPQAPLPQGEEASAQLEHLPAPPQHYKRFTSRNLELAELVSKELGEDADEGLECQNALLKKVEAEERPDFDLRELVNPPSLQGVVDRGGWEVFGVRNPIVELSSSLAELGIPQLYDASQDRKDSLRKLLNTVLVHYVQLLDELVKPPPGGGPRVAHPEAEFEEAPYQADILIDQIRLACLNMHMLCNELRPMQARETLVKMMRSQIDNRKARTEQLKKTCTEVSAAIADLKSRYNTSAMDVDAPAATKPAVSVSTSAAPVQDPWQRVVDAVDAL